MDNNTKTEADSAATTFPDVNPHPVLACRGEGRLTYCNPAAEQLAAELGLESARDLLPADHLEKKRSCLATHLPTTAETIVQGKVIVWSYRPIEGEAAVYLFGIDISSHQQSSVPGLNTLSMAALNHIETGVVAVDLNLQVLLSNQAADGLLSGDGLSVIDGHLAGFMQPITNKIRQMVTDVLQGNAVHLALAIPCPSGASIELSISALGAGEHSVALVFVFDPQSPHQAFTDMLEGLYGLTPTESRLAELLVEGSTLEAACSTLNIAKQSGKNLLLNVYKKTATHRQAELVQKILTGAAGTRL